MRVPLLDRTKQNGTNGSWIYPLECPFHFCHAASSAESRSKAARSLSRGEIAIMMGDEEARESPRDFETLRALIVERREVLPKRLAQVAVYALDNPDEIAFGTAASVAGSAAVQPSTLVRFAQAFGYQGFSELQEVFRSRLRERVPSYDERLARMRQHGIPT